MFNRICCHTPNRYFRVFGAFFIVLFFFSSSASAQVQDLKKLSMEQLMNLEVTLVTGQPAKLTKSASAIQVITNEDVRRSTSTRTPEALKLMSNLQVSQVNSYATVVGARGFNYIFSNKMLVMIDGRTVYSPIFAGVYWDVQNVLLEDIEHIEAVSGPGGTLWGMNAVNGVINIETKSAKETQGLYVSGIFGSYLNNFGAIRYGGKLGDKFSYRVFLQRYDYDSFYKPDGSENNDSWKVLQGGFRIDGNPTENDLVTIQGNAYDGTEFTVPTESTMDGQNILSRWTHTISDDSDYSLQVYYDRTWRSDAPSSIRAYVNTFDLEFQHSFSLGKRHSFLWGLGYRYVVDKILNSSDFLGFLPNQRKMPLYSGFIQDEITIIPDKLNIALGVKLQHNIYSGFEVLPNGRVTFYPKENHTLWAAASRAVRAPSRSDVDYHIPAYEVPPGTPTVDGGPDFVSEKVDSYELGYRIQPSDNLSISVSGFYNNYTDLFSVDPLPDDPVRYRIQNNTEGNSKGVEFYGIYQATKWWRIRTGYNYFEKSLKNTNGSLFDYTNIGHDPAHQVILHSMLDLPGNLQLDLFGRYTDELQSLDVPAYIMFNARLAWMFKSLEFEVAGRNLLNKYHQEFGEAEIPRNYYVGVSWRL